MTEDELRLTLAEMMQGIAGVLMEAASRIAPEMPRHPMDSANSATQESRSPVPPDEVLKALKKTTHSSWAMLGKGLRDLAGLPVEHSTENVANSSRSFARRAVAVTGLSAEELHDLLVRKGWVAKE